MNSKNNPTKHKKPVRIWEDLHETIKRFAFNGNVAMEEFVSQLLKLAYESEQFRTEALTKARKK